MTTAATMDAHTALTLSGPSSATYPRWVMFQQFLKIETEGFSSSTSGGACKTSAAARTSTGIPIHVSLRLAEPPAVSSVCLQIPYGAVVRESESEVLAAHGDSVLIWVIIRDQEHDYSEDHFVYTVGDAAAEPPRPPSLSLLPPFPLGYRGTGLVRRGKDELVVAHLHMVSSDETEPASMPQLTSVADLSLLRGGEWSVRRLPISVPNASEFRQLDSLWNAIVPVGDGLLCWVDLWHLGVVLCNVFEETPRLQYLPLPRENIWGPPSNRNLCATAGGGVLKFVNISPRCCCGGAGDSSCERSQHAYMIHTWTMRIGNYNSMKWVKDSMVDATELWALDSYKDLRRLPLDHPIVSTDDLDLICFWLHEPSVGYWEYSDQSVDLLMVNMRSKTIHSVSRYEDGLLRMRDDHLIPSNISDGTLTEQRQKGIKRPPPDIANKDLIGVKRQCCSSNTTNPTLQPASLAEPYVQASQILEAFDEIPSYGLGHDELKAYRILRRDNWLRFRSLVRLPKNLRKDWLLMEIKASEDC